MPYPITDKQLKYMNIILSQTFGENRKLFLKLFYKVDSSKDLTKDQASEIIELFIGPNAAKYKAEAMDKIYEALGQQRLI